MVQKTEKSYQVSPKITLKQPHQAFTMKNRQPWFACTNSPLAGSRI